MIALSRQTLVVACTLLVAGSGTWWAARDANRRSVSAGFWFEPVSYGPHEAMSRRLGGSLGVPELQAIERIARAELADAFTPLRIAFTDRDDAMYRVRVLEDLRNPRSPKYPGPAGESRSIPGLGGDGALNFRLLVNNAIAYAPPDADRQAIVAAIGRGIGRAAVHEFAHQLLGASPIHDTRDAYSYEFETAGRPQQYYGSLHWDTAWPELQRRIGPRELTDNQVNARRRAGRIRVAGVSPR